MIKHQKIVIVDYGVGNTFSVSNAIRELGYSNLTVTGDQSVISSADVLILPGVGAFDEAIRNLSSAKLIDVLNKEVLVNKKPLLGICVGMQLLATFSEENGRHEGLNYIPGIVKKLDLPKNFSVPHVGWNNVDFSKKEPLFTKIDRGGNFYFDHSYHFECDDQFVAAYCDYGVRVTAAVQKENIFGVQFHPERSHTSGLKMFRSFFNSIS